mmetsp:Transcript_42184/g.66055  ORF Transcript_42184/g.66055 Transcript_42184/m.66055 type:complete len:236 (+) Transcript_42184:1711-2418(+)
MGSNEYGALMHQQESQFAKLATLYNASARQIEVYLDDVDPVLEVPEKWRIINKLIHEKHEPELALLCLNIVTKTFSTAMKANKHTFAAAEALEDAFKKASGSKASAADEATQRRKAMVQALKVHSPTVPAAGSKPQPRMNSPGRHSQDRHSSPTAEKDGSHSPGSRSPLPRSCRSFPQQRQQSLECKLLQAPFASLRRVPSFRSDQTACQIQVTTAGSRRRFCAERSPINSETAE